MKKIIGSILMILGVCIGGGMLALPMATANQTFLTSAILMLGCWLLMSIGAFCVLYVNLKFPPGTNLINMAGNTLGIIGKIITWFLYLCLLYTLICAYLSACSNLSASMIKSVDLAIPKSLVTSLTLGILVLLIYQGIGKVDITNRLLMFFKLGAFIFLVILFLPFSHASYLHMGKPHFEGSAFLVIITSFGYAIILPSIRQYLHGNKQSLKIVFIIGSIIPLVLYLLWIFVIQSIIPRYGALGLISIAHSNSPNTALLAQLGQLIHDPTIVVIGHLFVVICVLTSFIGVSLCLTDFVADGLNLPKKGIRSLGVYALSFLPPLCIVLFAPSIFLLALSYAGIWCLLILVIIPIAMLIGVSAFKRERIPPGG